MKAKKLPSGNWRVQACHEGKRRSFTDSDKKTALFLAADWLAHETEKARPENRSVKEAIDDYISGRTNLLSPTTIQGYEKARDHFLADYLDLKVGKLTKQKVQSIVNELAGRYSPKTVRNAYGLLRSACELEFKVALPHKEKLEYKTPGIDGISSILEAVHDSPVEVPVLLSLWCGLRLSEVRGLRWSRVFEDHIVIDTAIVDVNRKPVLKTPKTEGSVRIIPINQWLFDRIQKEPHDTEFVTNLSGHAIYARFKRLTDGSCRFHDLRHANASLLAYLNVSDDIIMSRCGWTSPKMMREVYVQTFVQAEAEASEKIDNFFMQNLSHEFSHGDVKPQVKQ